jgi:hypothetical protein
LRSFIVVPAAESYIALRISIAPKPRWFAQSHSITCVNNGA